MLQAAAMLLPNGTVLVAGGFDGTTNWPAGTALASAEIFDPATGVWNAHGAAFHRAHQRRGHAFCQAVKCWWYPAMRSERPDYFGSLSFRHWCMVLGQFNSAIRFNHTATLLANGKVLVAGGEPTQVAICMIRQKLVDTHRIAEFGKIQPQTATLLNTRRSAGRGWLQRQFSCLI